MLVMIFGLLIFFQVKHFLADYLFQVQYEYLLQKFNPGWDFLLPLAVHAGVHAACTFMIVYLFTQSIQFSFEMAAIDLVIHFFADRLKAGPKYFGKWKALTTSEYSTASVERKRANIYFWWMLGFDQMIHHLTHYAIIFLVMLRLVV